MTKFTLQGRTRRWSVGFEGRKVGRVNAKESSNIEHYFELQNYTYCAHTRSMPFTTQSTKVIIDRAVFT